MTRRAPVFVFVFFPIAGEKPGTYQNASWIAHTRSYQKFQAMEPISHMKATGQLLLAKAE